MSLSRATTASPSVTSIGRRARRRLPSAMRALSVRSRAESTYSRPRVRRGYGQLRRRQAAGSSSAGCVRLRRVPCHHRLTLMARCGARLGSRGCRARSRGGSCQCRWAGATHILLVSRTPPWPVRQPDAPTRATRVLSNARFRTCDMGTEIPNRAGAGAALKSPLPQAQLSTGLHSSGRWNLRPRRALAKPRTGRDATRSR